MLKIRKNGRRTDTEIRAGVRLQLQKNPSFKLFFHIVCKKCPINLLEVDSGSSIANCEVLLRNDEFGYSILTTPSYIGPTIPIHLMDFFYKDSGDLPNYLYSSELLWKVIDTYTYILDALSYLQINQLIHFDIKMDNMLYNTRNETVQLTEFGSSLILDERQSIDTEYEIGANSINTNINISQSLEINLIRYLDHDAALTLEIAAAALIPDFVSAFAATFSFLPVEWLEKYRTDCEQVAASYVSQAKASISQQNKLFRHQVFIPNVMYTWDNYALSIAYLRLLGELFTDAQLTTNPFLSKYIQLLATTIHPDPSKRMDIATTKTQFLALVYKYSSTSL